jgi:hypothetical protein
MLSLNHRQRPSMNLPEILKATAIERVGVYITRPISLGTEGLELIVSGGKYLTQKEAKVKEIIHNCRYIRLWMVSVNHNLSI